MIADKPHTATATRRGYLMPIGGAEERTATGKILERFVTLSGGSEARIVIIPSASMFAAEVSAKYCEIFAALHAADIRVVDIRERQQANDPALSALFQDITGIFLTGGDQVKLVSLLGGTLLDTLLIRRFKAGATVAGTSAGASALSQHMVAFGRSGAAPSQRMVQLAPGLGLIDSVIIDQHFHERNRVGRLMTALAHNPSLIGIGVDENTAFIIGPDECEVLGSGSVTIVDGGQLEYTDIHSVKRYGPIAVLGMKVHILTEGCRYDLNTRRASPPIPQF